jgi:hypothetical protein
MTNRQKGGEMKGRTCSIVALLAILMLVVACPNVTDMGVAPDGGTIYIIGNNALQKSTDGGSSFTELTMPPAFVSPPRTLAVAPDDPNVVAASDSATNETVWVSTNGGATWVQLPPLNGAAANMRIMGLQVGPVRAGAILARDYLVATADEAAGVALGSLQIIGQTTNWVNVALLGTADFTSCEFSPNFIVDRVALAIGSTAIAGTSLYTYNTQIPVLVHAAVQLSGVTVDFGAAANGILVSDIALPSDYDVTTPSCEKAFASFASAAAAPNNGGVYQCNGALPAEELGLVGTRIHSIAYAGTTTSGKLLAGAHATAMVWHATEPWTTWTAASTPPTGQRDTVVGMHPDVLTNHICYAGTSGWYSGFFRSGDNAYTFTKTWP